MTEPDRADGSACAVPVGKSSDSQAAARRRVRIGDVELESVWLAACPASERTIVFLHEGLGSVSQWRDFPALLCARVGANGLLYSRQGYGQSTPLGGPRRADFMHVEAAVVLPELLTAFGIDHPILFGHSDGGSIALLYSAFFPEKPEACIVLAPHLFVEETSLRSIAAARVAFTGSALREKLSRHHADVDGAFFGWNDIWLDSSFRDWNIESCLQSVQTPVLAIQGVQDPYGTLAQIDRIAFRVPSARLVKLPTCGHAPQRDQPDAVLRAVTVFLDEVGRQRRSPG